METIEEKYCKKMGYHVNDDTEIRELCKMFAEFKAYLMDQAKKDKLTLQECKDKIANKYHSVIWDVLELSDKLGLNDIVSETYANQFIPVAPDREILQEAITLLMQHADGNFVSKSEAIEAGTNLHNLMITIPVATAELFGTHESWPLTDVLLKLIESTEYLLNVNNYDRHGWEEVQHCTKIGREYLTKITEYLSNQPDSTLTPAKVITDEEIEKRLNLVYPGWQSDGDFTSKVSAARSMAKWMREQLTKGS